MKFIYQYYYSFFIQHLYYYNKGTTASAPWYSALLQVTIGISMPLIVAGGIIWENIRGSYSYESGRVIPLFVMAAVLGGLYYLLFHDLKVSKSDGTTAHYPSLYTKSLKIKFWIIWLCSCILPVAFGVIILN